MKPQLVLIGGGVAMWLWTTAVLSVDPVVAAAVGGAVIGMIIVGCVLLRIGRRE